MKGSGTYPDNWRRLATEVKDQAGWRCVRCGHPTRRVEHSGKRGGREGSWVSGRHMACDEHCLHGDDGKRRILTVHHLDGDKGHSSWWNIPPLCQVCHLSIQAKVRMHQAYLLPHSPWFLPYVAGFYAWTILGEDLSRPAVMGRLDELLALGQPHLKGGLDEAQPVQ